MYECEPRISILGVPGDTDSKRSSRRVQHLKSQGGLNIRRGNLPRIDISSLGSKILTPPI